MTNTEMCAIIKTQKRKREVQKMKINGLNKNSLNENSGWVVARYIDDELWFWGAYRTEERAQEVADEIGGITVSAKQLGD